MTAEDFGQVDLVTRHHSHRSGIQRSSRPAPRPPCSRAEGPRRYSVPMALRMSSLDAAAGGEHGRADAGEGGDDDDEHELAGRDPRIR